jgi:hypothetical protein
MKIYYFNNDECVQSVEVAVVKSCVIWKIIIDNPVIFPTGLTGREFKLTLPSVRLFVRLSARPSVCPGEHPMVYELHSVHNFSKKRRKSHKPTGLYWHVHALVRPQTGSHDITNSTENIL